MKEFNWVWIFAVKSIIVAIVCFVGISALLPNVGGMKAQWDTFMSHRENQALILSFIQNPVALTLAGDRDVDQKRYEDAALKFELAIGLLEMHGAAANTIRPYQERLQKARLLAQKTQSSEAR